MKLSTIKTPNPIIPMSSAIDIDVKSNIGPAISKHIASIEALIKLVPATEDLCATIDVLKSQLGSLGLVSPTVIEANDPAPTVIDYDKDLLLGQQTAHIHGVGTVKIGNLPTKVVREVGFVEDSISEINEAEKSNLGQDELANLYKVASRWATQTARTATTLRNAISEMAVKRQLGSVFPPGTKINENSVTERLRPSIEKLKNRLSMMVENGSSLTYDSIDEVMQQICREDGCAPSDLHDAFVSSHDGQTPDSWAISMRESNLQLNENPLLIGAAGRALVATAPHVARGLGNILKWAAKNPKTAAVAGVAASNPTDTANVISGAVSVVADPGEAARQAARGVAWSTVDAAVNGINKIVGTNLTPDAVMSLASVAVKYALPIAAVVAVLYGGKKLYDYMASESPPSDAQARVNEAILGNHLNEQRVLDMYNQMSSSIGDKAWVVIGKKLRAEGHDQALIEKIINLAVIRVS